MELVPKSPDLWCFWSFLSFFLGNADGFLGEVVLLVFKKKTYLCHVLTCQHRHDFSGIEVFNFGAVKDFEALTFPLT